MKTFEATDMNALHDEMCQWFLDAKKSDFDYVTRIETQLHNVMAQANSMVWDQDLKDFWLTSVRWNAMVRQYLNPDAVEQWLDKCIGMGKRGRGIAILRTNEVSPKGGSGDSSVTRKWGSCLLSLSYRSRPTPQIGLHSRTSYLGYLGALDMSIAWVLAKYVADGLDIRLKDMKFVWLNECMQWHHFKSVGYMLNHPDPEEREAYRILLAAPQHELDLDELDELYEHPVQAGAREWLQKVVAEDNAGKTYGEMKYNTYRRVRRRYHREILGLEYSKQFEGMYYPKRTTVKNEPRMMKAYPALPSCPTQTLDLSAIGLTL